MNKGKKLLVGVTLILLFVLLAVKGRDVQKKKQENLEEMHVAVSVTDGVANPQNTVEKIRVEKDGKYIFCWNCKPDSKGLLTGCVVYSPDNYIVFAGTAEEITMETKSLELQAGDYRVEFYYITSRSDWDAFIKLYHLKQSDAYVFASDGEWDIELQYGVHPEEGRSMYYYLGMVCGFFTAELLIVFLSWIMKKAGGKFDWKCKADSYDERQMLARGKAYKYAFFSLIFYIFIISILCEFSGIILFMSFTGLWLGVCFSMMIFAITCILNDAYMSLYENVKGIIIMFSCIGLMNILIALRGIHEGNSMVENGTISTNCMNFIIGIMFLVLLIVFCGKVLYNKKQLEEDGE